METVYVNGDLLIRPNSEFEESVLRHFNNPSIFLKHGVSLSDVVGLKITANPIEKSKEEPKEENQITFQELKKQFKDFCRAVDCCNCKYKEIQPQDGCICKFIYDYFTEKK